MERKIKLSMPKTHLPPEIEPSKNVDFTKWIPLICAGAAAGRGLQLRAVRARVRLPLVASGGVGSLDHFAEGAAAGASGLLAASVFHDGIFRIAQAKAALAAAGWPVRPAEAPMMEAA
jgi:hypothetical protein